MHELNILEVVGLPATNISTEQTVRGRMKQAKILKDHFQAKILKGHFRKAILVMKTKFWDLKTFGVLSRDDL